MKVIIKSLEQTEDLANEMEKRLFPNFFMALNGDLGAGKTTFTKFLGKALGVKEIINSPTFTIMKVYDTSHNHGIDKLYHLDVYRLENAGDDFELEEYFYLDSVVVVEWCDIIKDIIPDDYLQMDITIDGDNRIFDFQEFGNIHILADLQKALEAKGYEIIC